MTGIGMTFSRKSDDMDYWWYAWLGANGADGNLSLWDENGKSRFNTPEAIAATQFLVDLAQKYKVTNPDYRDGRPRRRLAAAVLRRQAGHAGDRLVVPDPAEEQCARPQVWHRSIPVAKAGMKPVTAFWPDCVMMFKQSKHQAEAAKFLQ